MSIQPTKQAQHSEEIKKKIVECAQDLFNVYGFDNTGMKDIASAAGVTTGALYHHFGSKDEILRAVMETREYYSDDLFKKFETSENPREDLKELLCGMMVDQVYSDGIEFTRFRILKLFKFREGRGRRLDRCVEVLVERCIEKGSFTSELSCEEIADFLLSVYRGAVYQYCVSEDAVDLKALVEQRYDIAVRAVESRKDE